ncbi:MAG: hypothetical protein ACQETR_16550, partial [Thermodesulfobacteriota bacterium]
AGSPMDTLRKDSTLPPVTSKKSIVFLRMVKIAEFFKGLAVATYCCLKNFAKTLVSRFCFSTYLQICLRRKIAPTSRFAEVFQPS